MDVRFCMVCNREIVKVSLDKYVYKKQFGNKLFYACSWTCYNKMKVPNKKLEREQKMIEQELEGALPISDDYVALPKRSMQELREDAKESKEIAEKRREIERGLKRRNKHIVYWSRNNSTRNNN